MERATRRQLSPPEHVDTSLPNRGDSMRGGGGWGGKRGRSSVGLGQTGGRTALGFNTSARLLLLLLGGRRPPGESGGSLRNEQGATQRLPQASSAATTTTTKQTSGCGGRSTPKHTAGSQQSFRKENRCSASGADWAPRRPPKCAMA